MGEFGKMLIENFGGDIDLYEGRKPSISKTEVKKSEEKLKKRKNEFEKLRILSHARQHLDRLTNNIMYRKEISEQINKKLFIKSYKDIGYSLEVSKVMWSEYCIFINKYVKK